MNRFKFHSMLPPDEISSLMVERIGCRKETSNGVERISVKWNKNHVIITKSIQQSFAPGDGWQRTQKGNAVKGYGKSIDFSHPFSGILYSDGKGGSILEGRFVNHPAVKWIALAVMALVSLSSYFNEHNFKEILLYNIAILLLIVVFTKDKHKNENADAILLAIREIFEEIR